MKTKTINLYTYQELDQKGKQKAHEDWKAGAEYFDLKDYLETRLEDELEASKITFTEKPELAYSLSYCQGDGLAFYGHFDWTDKIGMTWHVEVKQYGRGLGNSIEFYDDNRDMPESDDTIIEFEALYNSICLKIGKDGYAWIEEENSDESFIRSCEANDYTFTKEGIMENE